MAEGMLDGVSSLFGYYGSILTGAASMMPGNAYVIDSICPTTRFFRHLTHEQSQSAFLYFKSNFSVICDQEDTFVRFFYDTWPKSIVTNSDNYSYLLVGLYSFLEGLSSFFCLGYLIALISLLVVILYVKDLVCFLAPYANLVLIAVYKFIFMPASPSDEEYEQPAHAFIWEEESALMRGLLTVWRIYLLPFLSECPSFYTLTQPINPVFYISCMHSCLFEPLGRRLLSPLGMVTSKMRWLSALDPWHACYYMLLESDEELEERKAKFSRKYRPFVINFIFRIIYCGRLVLKYALSITFLCLLLRFVCITTGIGPTIAFICGVITMHPHDFLCRQQKLYRSLTTKNMEVYLWEKVYAFLSTWFAWLLIAGSVVSWLLEVDPLAVFGIDIAKYWKPTKAAVTRFLRWVIGNDDYKWEGEKKEEEQEKKNGGDGKTTEKENKKGEKASASGSAKKSSDGHHDKIEEVSNKNKKNPSTPSAAAKSSTEASATAKETPRTQKTPNHKPKAAGSNPNKKEHTTPTASKTKATPSKAKTTSTKAKTAATPKKKTSSLDLDYDNAKTPQQKKGAENKAEEISEKHKETGKKASLPPKSPGKTPRASKRVKPAEKEKEVEKETPRHAPEESKSEAHKPKKAPKTPKGAAKGDENEKGAAPKPKISPKRTRRMTRLAREAAENGGSSNEANLTLMSPTPMSAPDKDQNKEKKEKKEKKAAPPATPRRSSRTGAKAAAQSGKEEEKEAGASGKEKAKAGSDKEEAPPALRRRESLPDAPKPKPKKGESAGDFAGEPGCAVSFDDDDYQPGSERAPGSAPTLRRRNSQSQ